MRRTFALLAACAALSTAAVAADPTGPADKKDSGSLSSGVKETMPATKNEGASSGASSGTSGNAQPDDKSLSGKAMKDQPGASGGGTTATPTAKPDDDSLAGEAKKDMPGAQ